MKSLVKGNKLPKMKNQLGDDEEAGRSCKKMKQSDVNRQSMSEKRGLGLLYDEVLIR